MQIKSINTAIDNAKRILKEIKTKYPTIDAFLVLSNNFGQMYPGSSIEIIFREFPNLFLPSPKKTNCLQLSSEIRNLDLKLSFVGNKSQNEELKKQRDNFVKQLNEFGQELEIDEENINIELRFGELDHDLLSALRSDPLIDKTRTPQTSAAIRIVLGTLRTLAEH
jgi:hypothetical protein